MIYLFIKRNIGGTSYEQKELAAQYHASGCNCAMAVGCAFCDKAGVNEDEMKALTRRYGGGAYKYCGALLGAVAAMNMASGQLNEDDPAVLDGKDRKSVV